jgi:hypothetical protein
MNDTYLSGGAKFLQVGLEQRLVEGCCGDDAVGACTGASAATGA